MKTQQTILIAFLIAVGSLNPSVVFAEKAVKQETTNILPILASYPGRYVPDGDQWILIDASQRRMVVKNKGFSQEFRVALGPEPDLPKKQKGDGRTPRGVYSICSRFRSNRFHRFLTLNYPTTKQAKIAAIERLITPVDMKAIFTAHQNGLCPPGNTRLGGDIGIHGWGSQDEVSAKHANLEDWTEGCIGVSNNEIEKIYKNAPVGTRVFIY